MSNTTIALGPCPTDTVPNFVEGGAIYAVGGEKATKGAHNSIPSFNQSGKMENNGHIESIMAAVNAEVTIGGTGEQAHAGPMDNQDDSSSDDEFPVWSGGQPRAKAESLVSGRAKQEMEANQRQQAEEKKNQEAEKAKEKKRQEKKEAEEKKRREKEEAEEMKMQEKERKEQLKNAGKKQ